MLLCLGGFAGATHLIVNCVSSWYLDLWLWLTRLSLVQSETATFRWLPQLLLSSEAAGAGRIVFSPCLSTFADFPFRLRPSSLEFALFGPLFYLPHFASLNILVIEQSPVIARVNTMPSVKSYLFLLQGIEPETAWFLLFKSVRSKLLLYEILNRKLK